MRGFSGKTDKTRAAGDYTLAGDDKGILAHMLMTEIMGTVPTFGNKQVVIGFHGDQAFCSEEHNYVNVPALPQAMTIPTPIAREIRGFAAHEAAHLMFTDFSVFKLLEKEPEEDRKLLHEIWNAIEDYMIERNFLSIYPGAHKNFTETERRCTQKYLESYRLNPDMAKDLRGIGPVALTWARAIEFGLKTDLPSDAMNTLPASLRQRVWNWFDDIIDVELSDDCFRHAKIILEDIKKQPFDPLDPPAPPPPQNQNNQNGQNQNGQGQTGQGQSGQGQGAQGQSAQGQGAQAQAGQQGQGNQAGQQNKAQQQGPGGNGQNPAANDKGQQQGQSPQGGQGGQGGQQGGSSGGGNAQDPANTPAPEPYHVGHSLDDALDNLGVTSASTPQFVSVADLSTSKTGQAAALLADDKGLLVAEQQKQACADTIGAVSQILRRALKSISRDRWKGGRMDGRIDDKRLASVVTGNIEIYRKKIVAPKIDTAVSILIDCSGSMASKLDVCQQLGLVMQAAFQGTPIKFEILGYTTSDNANLPPHLQVMAAAVHKKTGKDAVRSIALYEFSGFDSPYLETLRSIGNMKKPARSGTPTGDAILMAHQRLSARKERRHVMFVLTDGIPDNASECKKAVKATERHGCSVLGIGIGTNSIKKGFTNSVVINNVSDITAVVMSKMTDLLLKDRDLKGVRAQVPVHIVA